MSVEHLPNLQATLPRTDQTPSSQDFLVTTCSTLAPSGSVDGLQEQMLSYQAAMQHQMEVITSLW